jgi:hypothetical protein
MPTGTGATISFSGLRTAGGAELAGSEMGVVVDLRDDAPELQITVERLAFDESRLRLVRVEYPARFGALESYVELGSVVLPHWEGALVPTRRVTLPPLDLWMFEDATRSAAAMNDLPFPTMPWFGAYLDRADHAGFVCIVETPDDLQLQAIVNGTLQHRYDGLGQVSPLMRIAAASPVWLSSLGRLRYPRVARYRFGTGLDYVAMAKHYRAYARATGTFKSLHDKAAERPAVARLAGAPNLAMYAGYPHYAPGVHPAYANYRYADVQAAVNDLAGKVGLPRAFVHLWGGYTQQPPGALPFDTAPGPVSDLRAAVDAAHDAGYLFALYNYFTAMLEESPLWNGALMYQEANGRRMTGRAWNRVCAAHHVDLARKQMPDVVRTLGVQASYVDCVNVFWRECYDPAHPATRSEDIHRRLALQRYMQGLGLVFGGEHLQWWGVPAVDYCNGMGTPPTASRNLSQFSTPLWHLVFHDAVVAYGHATDNYARSGSRDFVDKALRDLLVGVPPKFTFNLFDYPAWRERIGLVERAMGETLRRVAFDEMESHAVVTEDRLVQRTRFSSGVEVTVNFGVAARDVGTGEPILPKGYVVNGLDRTARRGSFRLTFE